jgi:hypothetical protein
MTRDELMHLAQHECHMALVFNPKGLTTRIEASPEQFERFAAVLSARAVEDATVTLRADLARAQMRADALRRELDELRGHRGALFEN